MSGLRLILLVSIILACRAAAGEDSQPLFETAYQKQNAYGVMLYGTIEEMPESGYTGVWIVNGRKIFVTDTTLLRNKHGMPETGAYVKVEGHYSGNNLTAYEIEVKRERQKH